MNIGSAAEQHQRAWDLRFLQLARLVSTWSKDPSTQTGAVIVRPDKTVASIGFNGFAKQMLDDRELYAQRETKYQRIIHCEMNALLHTRESVEGYTLYTVPLASCDRCAVHMIQAGIARFVYPPLPSDKDDRWKDQLARAESYMDEACCQRTVIADLKPPYEFPGRIGPMSAVSDPQESCLSPHPNLPGVVCRKVKGHDDFNKQSMHANSYLAWGTA